MCSMPIYAEKVERPLCDPMAQGSEPNAWHPANPATLRLFRCVECLRDLNDLISEAGASQNPVKRRRKLKHAFVPMLSFAESIVDLIHILQSDQDAVSRMAPTDPKLLHAIKTRYLEFVPLGSQELLRRVRNKLAAHVDLAYSPADAQALFDQVEPRELGRWLHTALTVLSDLLKLKVYSWCVSSATPNEYRLMWTEPFIATFKAENGSIVALLDMSIVARSPRSLVLDLVRESVGCSGWMFGPKDPCIRGFTEDAQGSRWAKSLETLAGLKA